MPRPCKKRRICAKPSCIYFGPRDGSSREERVVVMTLDEYECVRLIDYEGRTQEQCAEQMDVARTTIQAIYSSARRKMAECLVCGCMLHIDGGDFTLCEKQGGCCKRYCSHGIQMIHRKGEDIEMRIAVTYENGQIFQHFGHTEQFKVYDVEDGKVVKTAVVDTNGSGHGALAGFLQENQVNTLICGGIGGGAQNALAAAGIRLFGGVSGEADAAVEALLKNELVYSTEATCSHHDHHEGDCGDHGCGDHGCGDHGCHH